MKFMAGMHNSERPKQKPNAKVPTFQLQNYLVGGFSPTHLKNTQVGLKIKQIFETTHPVYQKSDPRV